MSLLRSMIVRPFRVTRVQPLALCLADKIFNGILLDFK